MTPRVSVVIPAFEEGEGITACLDRILEAVEMPCEVLVVYDEPTDSTAPYAQKYADADPRVRPTLNTYGHGPAHAIRFGIDAACAPVVVVSMADGCDDPRQVTDLTRLVERGVVVAAASRYCAGGQQVGGPVVKRALSRAAGLSLHRLARVGTRDATNSFKAYSRPFVQKVGIDSREGFEIGLELTVKAKRLGLPVAELPTIWLDRRLGTSHFHLVRWLPAYLRWYRLAFGPRLDVPRLAERVGARP